VLEKGELLRPVSTQWFTELVYGGETATIKASIAALRHPNLLDGHKPAGHHLVACGEKGVDFFLRVDVTIEKVQVLSMAQKGHSGCSKASCVRASRNVG
jgi:hypothetical protein